MPRRAFLTSLSCNSAYRLRYWNWNIATYLRSAALASCNSAYRLRYWNVKVADLIKEINEQVATVLTACGIETGCDTPFRHSYHRCNSAYRLRYWNVKTAGDMRARWAVATVLTACGIETWKFKTTNNKLKVLQQCLPLAVLKLVRWCAQAAGFLGCNSAYRLRYWNHKICLTIE